MRIEDEGDKILEGEKMEELFSFPDSEEIKVKLVKSVPVEWKVIRGTLYSSLSKPEKIVFSFGEKNLPSPTLRLDGNKKDYSQTIDLNGPPALGSVELINLEPKLYRELCFLSVKAIIISLLRKNYGGIIDFARAETRPEFGAPATYCSMIFELKKRKNPGVTTVRIVADELLGGAPEDVEPILVACRSFSQK